MDKRIKDVTWLQQKSNLLMIMKVVPVKLISCISTSGSYVHDFNKKDFIDIDYNNSLLIKCYHKSLTDINVV